MRKKDKKLREELNYIRKKIRDDIEDLRQYKLQFGDRLTSFRRTKDPFDNKENGVSPFSGFYDQSRMKYFTGTRENPLDHADKFKLPELKCPICGNSLNFCNHEDKDLVDEIIRLNNLVETLKGFDYKNHPDPYSYSHLLAGNKQMRLEIIEKNKEIKSLKLRNGNLYKTLSDYQTGKFITEIEDLKESNNQMLWDYILYKALSKSNNWNPPMITLEEYRKMSNTIDELKWNYILYKALSQNSIKKLVDQKLKFQQIIDELKEEVKIVKNWEQIYRESFHELKWSLILTRALVLDYTNDKVIQSSLNWNPEKLGLKYDYDKEIWVKNDKKNKI